MMPHPHTICEMAAMDHRERQARAEQDRLGARAARRPPRGPVLARGAARRLGDALVRVGARLGGAPTAETAAPAATAVAPGPAR